MPIPRLALLPLTASTVCASILIASPAFAQSAPAPESAAPSNLTANVTLTTNYKVRGQDQDQIGRNGYYKTKALKPAIQGGFDYAFGNTGFYVGNWNSSVNWLYGNSIETDFFGGYKFKGGPIDWDVGVFTYVYPGNAAGNTTELYGSGTWGDEALGSFTVKYNLTVSKDYINYAGSSSGSGLKGRGTTYLNLAWTKPLVSQLSLAASVGFTRMSSDIRSLGYENYIDYNIGGAWDFGSGLSLSASVQGANKQNAYRLPTANAAGIPDGGSQSINKPRFILALTKEF